MNVQKLIFHFSLCSSLVFAESKESQVSETLGHIIGENLQRLNIQLDLNKLVQGIQDAALDKQPPMTKETCIQIIEEMQKKKSIEEGEKNLQQAASFLADQAKQEGIVLLESGKVQYRIIKEGQGECVQANSTPSVRYTIKDLSDPSSCFSEEGVLSLAEAIPGLKAGIIGMKEGEQRVVYIHPDLAYGDKEASILPSHLLLIFEIEILKAHKAF